MIKQRDQVQIETCSVRERWILGNTSYMPRAMPRVNYFLHFKNSQDLKVLGFFTKLYPRISGLVATPNPRVMFIILIITLNLG